MNKQWQNKHIRAESVPVQRGGLVAIEPPEDLYPAMESRLFIIPEANDDTEGLPEDAGDWVNVEDAGFTFDEVQVRDWGMMAWPRSPHAALYFGVTIKTDHRHFHIAAANDRHAASKGGNR